MVVCFIFNLYVLEVTTTVIKNVFYHNIFWTPTVVNYRFSITYPTACSPRESSSQGGAIAHRFGVLTFADAGNAEARGTPTREGIKAEVVFVGIPSCAVAKDVYI